MTSERLIYLPLGGAGEVGMNCYVYGWGEPGRERLIVVDLGVTFGDMDGSPGVDLIFPDVTWLAARKDRLEAIFITHAHEDHVGAIGHLAEQLGHPTLYCRKFTAIHARRKLIEQGHDDRSVRVVAEMEAVRAGPFTCRFMSVAHSIPEASAVLIDTPVGRLLHTGDFKTDQTPMLGEAHDPELWRREAGDGVHALICDSTNVNVDRSGRSERAVAPEIERLVREAAGMVVATTFASNVARVKSMALAGVAAGRTVCLLGRAMQRMVAAGEEAGILDDFPTTVPVEEARDLPRGDLMLIVTGSQGERRAASAQLSRGKYLGIEMKEGDTFLFSSKTIPGNERGVLAIQNAFSELGVRVQDDDGGRYHVSGHANGPDIKSVHELTRPRMVIPMHGDHLMLSGHARMATEAGIATAIAPNGTMLDLTEAKPKVAEHVETGRVYLDGTAQIGAMDGVVRDRLRLALNGHAIVTLIVDEDGGALGEPWVETMGLPETGRSGNLVEVLEGRLDKWVQRAGKKGLADDDEVDEQLRRILRNAAKDEIGKKPEVTVIVSRLG